MKTLKRLTRRFCPIIMLAIFTNCASSQRIDQESPIALDEPYFQKWVAGIQEGGSGFDIYLPVEDTSNVILNTAYFKGKEISLTYNKGKGAYYGHYTYPQINKGDIIMSDDPKKEYGNPIPTIEKKIPFNLQGNECIIAYTKDGNPGYFKIDALAEREILAYPSQPQG